MQNMHLHKQKQHYILSFLERSIPAKIRYRISCLMQNVIYMMTCLKCRTQYARETKRMLKKRMYEHLRSMNTVCSIGLTLVSEQFNLCCKRPAKLTFQVLQTMRGDPTLDDSTTSKKWETQWILNLCTPQPMGINEHVQSSGSHNYQYSSSRTLLAAQHDNSFSKSFCITDGTVALSTKQIADGETDQS